jgi:hypothetical protein
MSASARAAGQRRPPGPFSASAPARLFSD